MGVNCLAGGSLYRLRGRGLLKRLNDTNEKYGSWFQEHKTLIQNHVVCSMGTQSLCKHDLSILDFWRFCDRHLSYVKVMVG